MADEPIDICFTSPFSRAVDTARLTVADRSVPIYQRIGLGEVRCGDRFEGRKLDEYVAWVQQEGMFVAPPGDGTESFADTLMRYHDELLWIAGQRERVALVVAHGTPVAFARRVATYAAGEQLLPFPEAMPALPYRIPVDALVEGLKRAWSRIAFVASQDDLGRPWALRRSLSGPQTGPHARPGTGSAGTTPTTALSSGG